MDIRGKIIGLKYKVLLAEDLKSNCIGNYNKHSKNAILPSVGDIKDGLLKMIFLI
jgi:hypothetical protein